MIYIKISDVEQLYENMNSLAIILLLVAVHAPENMSSIFSDALVTR